MTANEMRNLFKELYDGASAQEMGYDDIEVSRFLNLAQDIILNEKFFAFRNRQTEGFENSSKRDTELNNLKRTATLWFDINLDSWVLRTYSGIIDDNVVVQTDKDLIDPYNTILIEIPNEILYVLRDTVDIKKDKELIRNVRVKNINEDNINYLLYSPFTKPDETVVYRTLIVKDVFDDFKMVKLFLPEDYNLNRWNITYLKRPIKIVVDILNPNNQVNCELDEIIHNDIVFKAVELALGAIGSQKFQIANLNKQINVN